VQNLADLRFSKKLPYLRPDGKSQVTIEYINDKPVRAHTVVVAAQHNPQVSEERLRREIMQKLIKPTLGKWIDSKTIFHINSTGRFVIGGPQADTGLTGRKVIADTYGGRGAHGGGSFSGKDPTKVDRSASYAARHCAKNIVAAGLADKCEVQLAYAIGISQPVSATVDTEGTAKIKEDRIAEIVRELFDFSPSGMIKRYDLRRPIYKATARHGHFGKQGPNFTWEKLDMVDKIKKLARM
jgi:S-adenosylmethionine synthetase